jgi:hypothetical protein
MTRLHRATRVAVAIFAIAAASACSSAGGLGNVLGGVLGGGQQQASQVSGTVRGVDTRNQQIVLQLSDGQQASLFFDNQTSVVYQNQNYPVTSLEAGDRVTARIQSTSNGNGYYTDYVQVDQSAQQSGGVYGSQGGVYGSPTSSNNVQALQGTVRQVDRTNGLFSLQANNGAQIIVSMPYNPTRNDVSRFESLRAGDNVRFYGVFLNNSRVELRQFY